MLKKKKKNISSTNRFWYLRMTSFYHYISVSVLILINIVYVNRTSNCIKTECYQTLNPKKQVSFVTRTSAFWADSVVLFSLHFCVSPSLCLDILSSFSSFVVVFFFVFFWSLVPGCAVCCHHFE